jgi:ubiquinone biosynthesis monooxygenase Coq7
MNQTSPQLTTLDQLIGQFDKALTTLTGGVGHAQQPSPGLTVEQPHPLTDQQRRLSLSLMRVNHSGEVCAQALYQGQGLTAKLANVRHMMEQAASEEQDHLAWCEQRIAELEGHTSYLNPLWYGLSLGLGAVAGLLGDKWSLGFVVETEHQVEAHLAEHLQQLPAADSKSRAIVKQMAIDEAKHAHQATEAGGADLPKPVKLAMGLMARVMKSTSHYL